MKLSCTIQAVTLIQTGTVILATRFSGSMMYFMSNILRQIFYMMYSWSLSTDGCTLQKSKTFSAPHRSLCRQFIKICLRTPVEKDLYFA